MWLLSSRNKLPDIRSHDIKAAEKIVALHTEINANELNLKSSNLEEANLSLKLHTLSVEQLVTYNGKCAPFPSRNMTLALLSSNYATSETYLDSFLWGTNLAQTRLSQLEYENQLEHLNYMKGKEVCKSQKIERQSNQYRNDWQMALLASRKLRQPNFIKLNARRNYSYEASYTCSTETRTFNYSCQKKSSTAQQLSKLREDLQKRFIKVKMDDEKWILLWVNIELTKSL
ncbi:hypothetical protein HK103_005307 [Boothiomyces macroporosus]|uniref:Uncharacterized protein n=1 Tax=Boothiomyces macroporosus TaxID=261099 RepID=A0AAD5UJL4_9FUNG|nr:hypothetical protein HK103_005307 [Boothiomyces macroporosus]